MQAIDKVVGEDEGGEPDQQDGVVDQGAVEQEGFQILEQHGDSPDTYWVGRVPAGMVSGNRTGVGPIAGALADGHNAHLPQTM